MYLCYYNYCIVYLFLYIQRETHPTQQSSTSNNNINNNSTSTIHELFNKSTDDSSDSSDCSNMSTTSIVPEEHMPELWLPGRILHLYTYRGQYRISRVDCTYTSLRTIEVQGNMFRDHTSNDIFDALLEARAVYNAPAQPPVWTAYDRTDRCACCKSTFTWHSTFRG